MTKNMTRYIIMTALWIAAGWAWKSFDSNFAKNIFLIYAWLFIVASFFITGVSFIVGFKKLTGGSLELIEVRPLDRWVDFAAVLFLIFQSSFVTAWFYIFAVVFVEARYKAALELKEAQ